MPQTTNTAPAPEAGVLPSAPLPACFQSERPRPIRHPCRSVPEPAISRSPGPPAGAPRDPRLRHVLIKYPVGESNPDPTGIRSPSADPLDGAQCARTSSAVGWEVLEPSSPALQTGATPSQLPAQQKKPGVFCDTGLWQKSRYFDGRVSQAPVAHGERIRRLTGDMPRAFLLANVTRPQGHHFWLLLLKAAIGPLAGHLRH